MHWQDSGPVKIVFSSQKTNSSDIPIKKNETLGEDEIKAADFFAVLEGVELAVELELELLPLLLAPIGVQNTVLGLPFHWLPTRPLKPGPIPAPCVMNLVAPRGIEDRDEFASQVLVVSGHKLALLIGL